MNTSSAVKVLGSGCFNCGFSRHFNQVSLWQLDRGNEKLSYEHQLLERAQQSPKDLELVISDWQRGNTQAQVDLTRQIWNGQRSTSLWQHKAVWSSC